MLLLTDNWYCIFLLFTFLARFLSFICFQMVFMTKLFHELSCRWVSMTYVECKTRFFFCFNTISDETLSLFTSLFSIYDADVVDNMTIPFIFIIHVLTNWRVGGRENFLNFYTSVRFLTAEAEKRNGFTLLIIVPKRSFSSKYASVFKTRNSPPFSSLTLRASYDRPELRDDYFDVAWCIYV